MGRSQHPPEKRRGTCPRCSSGKIRALPRISPDSYLDWFHCVKCDHMWYHRRDLAAFGEHHP